MSVWKHPQGVSNSNFVFSGGSQNRAVLRTAAKLGNGKEWMPTWQHVEHPDTPSGRGADEPTQASIRTNPRLRRRDKQTRCRSLKTLSSPFPEHMGYTATMPALPS